MALPDLDDLISEVDQRCSSGGFSGHDQPDWIELLKAAVGVAVQLQALGDDLVEEYVEHCRLHGSSWAEVGDALGITRQAVQQRFRAPHREYAPEDFSEELQRAMTAMKDAAVQHRNNFIGTEHLLWGIIAEDNSAAAWLAAREVSTADVQQALKKRMTVGASQAAQRIAWTPYSRKAMALAREAATREGTANISCRDLLVALISLDRGVAAKVLLEVSVTADDIEQAPA